MKTQIGNNIFSISVLAYASSPRGKVLLLRTEISATATVGMHISYKITSTFFLTLEEENACYLKDKMKGNDRCLQLTKANA